MDYNKLAELLFPHIKKTPEEYEKIYPQRNLPADAKVTRLGPSPTGFIHLGNLYGAFVDERLAHQSGGVFFLRIEDTDDKRYVEGAVDIIIDSLRFLASILMKAPRQQAAATARTISQSAAKSISALPKNS